MADSDIVKEHISKRAAAKRARPNALLLARQTLTDPPPENPLLRKKKPRKEDKT